MAWDTQRSVAFQLTASVLKNKNTPKNFIFQSLSQLRCATHNLKWYFFCVSLSLSLSWGVSPHRESNSDDSEYISGGPRHKKTTGELLVWCSRSIPVYSFPYGYKAKRSLLLANEEGRWSIPCDEIGRLLDTAAPWILPCWVSRWRRPRPAPTVGSPPATIWRSSLVFSCQKQTNKQRKVKALLQHTEGSEDKTWRLPYN